MNQPKPLSQSLHGFYLHGCWEYAYPFAVRSWQRQDFAGMFEVLRLLKLNHVMLWPLTEVLPPPINAEEMAYLDDFAGIIDDAKEAGLTCWLVTSANLTSDPAIRAMPVTQRHFYPYAHTYRVDDPQSWPSFVEHQRTMLARLNRADGYVVIDGDPGGYEGARPQDFLKIFEDLRGTLDAVGHDPQHQEVVPWLWCGWGRRQGDVTDAGAFWKHPVEPHTRDVLALFRQSPPPGPWTILPGRSHRADWANGRVNLKLTEDHGMTPMSVLAEATKGFQR